jgi:hypothetical protein
MSSSGPNKKFPGQTGFPTPNAMPDLTGCRVFSVPSDEEWFALLMAAVDKLTYEWAWYKNGTLSQAEAAAAWSGIIDRSIATALQGQCSDVVETPFWDDTTDVETNEPVDAQPWYGYVENPTAPAGELTFVESALLWAFTGLVAVATFEVGGLAPAIFFHTTVEKFIIIQKRGDAAETIRYVIDNQDMKYVDTSPYAPGELIEVPIIAPETGMGHDLMIISTVPS